MKKTLTVMWRSLAVLAIIWIVVIGVWKVGWMTWIMLGCQDPLAKITAVAVVVFVIWAGQNLWEDFRG